MLNGELFNATQTIHRGYCGRLVMLWQEYLAGQESVRAVHGSIDVDGRFYGDTEAASRTAQKLLGVKPDGRPGKYTFAAAKRRAVENGYSVTSARGAIAVPCPSRPRPVAVAPTQTAAPVETDRLGFFDRMLTPEKLPVVALAIGAIAFGIYAVETDS